MRRITRVTVLLGSILLCLTYYVNSAPMAQSSDKDKKAGAPVQMDAAMLFKDNCAKCHGEDGRAKTVRGKMVGARNLASEKFKAGATEDRIIAALKKGPGAMPSFEKKFSPEQMQVLATYVRNLKQEEKESK